MALKAGNLKRLQLTIIVVILTWIVSGCAPKSAKLPTYMRPELLYLNEQPYSRLYIEVDTVEGVEVPDRWLDTLKEFLSTHCSKPDGIEIVRDEPIPFDDIKDMPIGPASILCLDGPDPNSGSQPAYLHVFFYDKDKIFKKATDRPYVAYACPCTIFFNTDYLKHRKKQWVPHALSHEAGHILGLCKNKSHGDGSHCKRNNCLMNTTPGLLSEFGLLFGISIKKQLCNDCLSDIETYKSEDADPNLVFKGPFLIRREEGYSVASAPYFNILIPSFLEDNFGWQQTLMFQKEVIKKTDFGQFSKKKGMVRSNGLYIPKSKEDSQPDMKACLGSLIKATKDPNPEISHFAATELEKIKQRQTN
jgi:hypothetical protein